MAVPTVTSISPSIVRSIGGSVVQIIGTNFRLVDEVVPDPSELGGIVDRTWQETVKVLVNGIDVGSVEVLSESSIQFLIPMYQGNVDDLPFSATISVSNLDDDGNEIDGETVMVEDGITYQQKDLTRLSHLAGLVAKVISMTRIATIKNVSIATDIDWTEIGQNPRQDREPTLPAIYIRGPKIVETKDDLTVDELDVEEADGETHYRRLREPTIALIQFQFIGVSDNTIEILNLGQAFIEYIKNNGIIVVDKDPESPSSGTREYEMGFALNGFPDYRRVGTLHQFTSTVEIDRVVLTPEEVHVIEKGSVVHDGSDSDWSLGLPASWLTFERKR